MLRVTTLKLRENNLFNKERIEDLKYLLIFVKEVSRIIIILSIEKRSTRGPKSGAFGYFENLIYISVETS